MSNKGPSVAAEVHRSKFSRKNSPSTAEVKDKINWNYFYILYRQLIYKEVSKTAVANSAIWPFDLDFLVTEWGSLNSHPCQSIYKPEEACFSLP